MARYLEVSQRYRGGRLSCVETAELLGISERHFRRLRDRYEAEGPEGLIDPTARTRLRAAGAGELIEFAVEQYRTRYRDFTEILAAIYNPRAAQLHRSISTSMG
jgi:Helix-turn-helix domain